MYGPPPRLVAARIPGARARGCGLAARGKELSRLWLGKDGDEAVVLMAEKSDGRKRYP